MSKRGEEWEEYDNAVKWMVITFLIAISVTIILALISMPLGYLLGTGISKDSLSDVGKYFSLVFNKSGYLFSRYWRWMRQLSTYQGEFSFSLWIPILPFLSFPIILIIGIVSNPYHFQSNIHGSARIAELGDIKKMELLGFDGFCQVVGKFNGKLLLLKETLSTLCCAPPGTGKTAGVVVPTIFNSPGLSIIVNDPKPELCYQTSGARAKVGPVFIINWGMEDNPEEGIYYPSWNPLSPGAVPALGPARDMYIDSMCNVLVEDPNGLPGNVSFSADGKWLTYTRSASNDMSVIYAYDMAAGKEYPLTEKWYSSHSPRFSNDGKYIIFTSARDFNPTYGSTEWNHVYNNMNGVYLVLLYFFGGITCMSATQPLAS